MFGSATIVEGFAAELINPWCPNSMFESSYAEIHFHKMQLVTSLEFGSAATLPQITVQYSAVGADVWLNYEDEQYQDNVS